MPREKDFQYTQKASKIIGAKDVVHVQTFERLDSGELVIKKAQYYSKSKPNEQVVYEYEYDTRPARLKRRRNYLVIDNTKEEFEEVVEWRPTT